MLCSMLMSCNVFLCAGDSQCEGKYSFIGRGTGIGRGEHGKKITYAEAWEVSTRGVYTCVRECKPRMDADVV